MGVLLIAGAWSEFEEVADALRPLPCRRTLILRVRVSVERTMLGERLVEWLAILEAAGCPIRTLVASGGRAREAAAAFPEMAFPAELATWFDLVGLAEPVAWPTADAVVIGPEFQALTVTAAVENHRFLVAQHGDPLRSDVHVPDLDRLVPIARLGWTTYLAQVGHRTCAPVRVLAYPDEVPPAGLAIAWPSLDAMISEWVEDWHAGNLHYMPGVGVIEVWP